MMIRTIFSSVLTCGAILIACSSDDTKPATGSSSSSGSGTSSSSSGSGASSSSSGGGSGYKDCGQKQGTCTEAELKPYTECFDTGCKDTTTKCYGPDYKTGKFTGSCSEYITCTQKCGCTDTACFTACKPSTECSECLKGFSTCASGCTSKLPACATAQPDAGATKTCADLQTCCGKIADATKKMQCTTAYDAVKGSGDAACNGLYSTYANDCK